MNNSYEDYDDYDEKMNKAIIQQILQNRYNAELNILKLNDCCKNKIWFHALKSKNFTQLKTLLLKNCMMNAHNINKINDFQWDCLQALVIDYNLIGYVGVKCLSRIYLPKLNYLSLNECLVGNQVVRILSKGCWRSLSQLWIGKNHINDYQQFYLADWQVLRLLNTKQRNQKNKLQNPIRILQTVYYSSKQLDIITLFRNWQFLSDTMQIMKKRNITISMGL